MDPSTHKHRPVLQAETVVRVQVREPLRTGSEILVRIGAALLLVGFVKVLLLWLPLDFANAGWRFGTVSQTVAALPVSAVGAALLLYGVVRGPDITGSRVRVLSVAFFILAIAFPILGWIYLSAIGPVFADAPDVAQPPLRREVFETAVGLLVAFAASVAVAIAMWRGVTTRAEAVQAAKAGHAAKADRAEKAMRMAKAFPSDKAAAAAAVAAAVEAIEAMAGGGDEPEEADVVDEAVEPDGAGESAELDEADDAGESEDVFDAFDAFETFESNEADESADADEAEDGEESEEEGDVDEAEEEPEADEANEADEPDEVDEPAEADEPDEAKGGKRGRKGGRGRKRRRR